MSIRDRVENPPGMLRMRCPGCNARLKFPARRAGARFKHKCGERFPLAPDPSVGASTEGPAYVPSEDVSGLLPPVPAEPDPMARMRCPGCQAKLKFPRAKSGKRFHHKCGASFQLRADPDAKASAEGPAFVPSEDISGLLQPVSMKDRVENAPAALLRMRCPGCEAKLKFPAKKQGKRFKHKCGKRFRLVAGTVSVSTAGGLPSEDLSGMLDRLELEEPPADECSRMHCPGCFRRLRYDEDREGEVYIHSCGSRFKLKAEDGLEASSPDDPVGSEYLRESYGSSVLTSVEAAAVVASSLPAPRLSGSGSSPARRRNRRPVSSGSGAGTWLALAALVLAVGGAGAMAWKMRGSTPDEAARGSGEAVDWTPMQRPPEPEEEPDRELAPPPRGEPRDEPEEGPASADDDVPEWWKQRQREAAERAAREAAGDDTGPTPAGVEPAAAEPVAPPPLVDPQLPWSERFLAGMERLPREKERRPELLALLGEAMGESLHEAQGSFTRCERSLALFDPHARALDEAPLDELLLAHRRVWFKGALPRATGPYTLGLLEERCRDYKLKAEAAEVEALRDSFERTAGAAGRREGIRSRRAEARAEVEDFIADTVARAEGELEQLVVFLEESGSAPLEAKIRMAGLIDGFRLRPDAGKRLLDRLDALGGGTEEDGTEVARAFQRKVDRLVDPITKKLGKAANDLVRAGMAGLGFDVFQTLLQLDPENTGAHRGLGHVERDGRWYRAYEAQQFKAGYVWDDELGWIKRDEPERYDNWEVYDIQAREWKDFEAANREHSAVDNPWRLESEHFVLLSTADLDVSARALKRLEAVFLQVFRQYDLFFPGETGARFIFGAGNLREKLVVHLYRSEDQFRAHANPPTDWAAGFYSGSRKASFFYCTGKRFSVRTLQHELIHHILGEFSSDHAPAWLAEGAAVYLEDAFFDGGFLRLGSLSDNDRVLTYARNLRNGGDEHSLSEVLRLETSAQWDSGDISKNYRGAGAVMHFLMRFDDGRYRGDAIAMLADSYRGELLPVEEYFGLKLASLERLMDRYYRELPLPRPQGR